MRSAAVGATLSAAAAAAAAAKTMHANSQCARERNGIGTPCGKGPIIPRAPIAPGGWLSPRVDVRLEAFEKARGIRKGRETEARIQPVCILRGEQETAQALQL